MVLAEPPPNPAVLARNRLISRLLPAALVAALGSSATAQPSEPPPPPLALPLFIPPAPAAPAPPDLDPAAYADLSDDELIALAAASGEEVIVVWDERPDKPFDRDTQLRLTDGDLAGRGVSHLADALELVPEVTVRSVGRGGQQIDIRGSRKAAVRILVDGIPLEDPFYGTFDLTQIAITDIAQVRVATSPSSPIDGPGGPGGVIEVHTRDAVGDRLIVGRASGDTLPTAAAAATGRSSVAPAWGVRASVTGVLGMHDYTVGGDTLDEDEHFTGGAVRAEWRPPGQEARRAVVDVAGHRRAYVVPPIDEDLAAITVIDGEEGARATAAYDDRVGEVQLALRGHGYLNHRVATYYRDVTMTEETDHEDLRADRAGASALANRALGSTMQVIGAAHLISEGAVVTDALETTRGRSTIAGVAAGWQLERGRWDVDAAAGAALPLDVAADPWPEGKLAASVRAAPGLTLTTTLARKGRLPTLRERYQVGGNEGLAPEQTTFAEAKAAWARGAVALEAAGWARRQDGMIRRDPGSGVLENLDRVELVGVDARAEARPVERVALAAMWSWIDADDGMGGEPLDFLPAHRVTAQAKVTPHPTVAATARLRWTDERIDKAVTLPAYAEVEAELVWTPTPRWLVSARGEDLLDERWLIHVGIPSAGRTFMLAVQHEIR